jgi:hypothetical protein
MRTAVVSRVYLDNVIVSGYALRDLRLDEAEIEAVDRLYAMHDEGIIKRVTSKISAIEQARTQDLEKRATLAASAHLVSVVQNDHRLVGFSHLDYGARGFISYPLLDDIVDPVLFEQLTAGIGLKDADAKHVMYAVANDCDYFVTVDTRDLLPNRSAIEATCPKLRVMWPTEAVAAIAGGRPGPGARHDA